MENNCYGYTTLHYVSSYNASTEVIMKLIGLGGQEIVRKKTTKTCLTLYYVSLVRAKKKILKINLDHL